MTSSLKDITTLRANLWKNGYRPVAICNHDSDPTRSPGKRPIGFGWILRARSTPPEAALVLAVHHGRNTGILSDGLRALDIDFDDVEVSTALTALAFRTIGTTIMRTRRTSGKVLLLYRAALGEPRKRALVGQQGKVEVLGWGQQFVAFGMHVSGATLEWPFGSPLNTLSTDLPRVTEEQISDYLEAARTIVGDDAVINATEDTRHSSHGSTADLADIASAMNVIPNAGPADWSFFNRIGMALWVATEGSEQGCHLFDAWAELNPAYDSAVVAERWAIYPSSPPDRIGAGTIFYLACKAVPSWRRPSATSTGGAEFDALPAEPVSELPRYVVIDEITEDAAALKFVEYHAASWVFDHDADEKSGWWYLDPKIGWKQNKVRGAFEAVRNFLRDARAHWGEGRSTSVAKRSFISGVESMSRSDQRIAICYDDWNVDPWLLGVPGGYIDLRSRSMRPASRDVLIRRRTAVAPAAGQCPVWLRFLDQTTGGDSDLVSWLQRFMGYALTGDVTEEMVAFFYGSGGNGKGTVLHVLHQIMDDYAVQVPAELFKADSRVNKEYIMAQLAGARLLLASETEEGAALAEALVKELSGNEGEVSARHPYGRPFTYRSQAKLLIVGNYAPSLRGKSAAMERRFRIVPFNRTPSKPDLDLKTKLAFEYPQILAWMIEGCIIWQRDRLGTCAAIASASRDYFEDQDVIGKWMAECCDLSAAHTVTSSEALDNYNTWRRGHGEKPTNSKGFKETITRVAGVVYRRTKLGSGYSGFGLRAVDTMTRGEEFTEPPAELVH